MPASVLAGTAQYTDLGAVMAQLNNQSELAGGLGASGEELAARYIAGQLSPGKNGAAAERKRETTGQRTEPVSRRACRPARMRLRITRCREIRRGSLLNRPPNL